MRRKDGPPGRLYNLVSPATELIPPRYGTADSRRCTRMCIAFIGVYRRASAVSVSAVYGRRQMAPIPGPVRRLVSSVPSVTRKRPGNLSTQDLFAAGTYWREFPSIPDTPGTCAAMLAEWTNEAPGQVRSWTQRYILYFWQAAAISIAWLCPLHAFNAAPV